MPTSSLAPVTAANSRKNHLYLMRPAFWSLSAMEPISSSAVTSMVMSWVDGISRLKANRSLASSQPTPARMAEATSTQRIYRIGLIRRRRRCWGGRRPPPDCPAWLRRTWAESQLAVSPFL